MRIRAKTTTALATAMLLGLGSAAVAEPDMDAKLVINYGSIPTFLARKCTDPYIEFIWGVKNDHT